MCSVDHRYFVNDIFSELESVEEIKKFNKIIKNESRSWSETFIEDIVYALHAIIDVMSNKSKTKVCAKFLKKTQSLWRSPSIHIGALGSAKETRDALRARRNIVEGTGLENKDEFGLIEEKMNDFIYCIVERFKKKKHRDCLRRIYKEIDDCNFYKMKGIEHYLESAYQESKQIGQKLCILLFFINLTQHSVQYTIKMDDDKTLSLYLSVLLELFETFSIFGDEKMMNGKDAFVMNVDIWKRIVWQYIKYETDVSSNAHSFCHYYQSQTERNGIYEIVSHHQRLNKIMRDWLAKKHDFSSMHVNIFYKLPINYGWNIFALFKDVMIAYLQNDGHLHFDWDAMEFQMNDILKRSQQKKHCEGYCCRCWYILNENVLNDQNIGLYVEFIAKCPQILFDGVECNKMKKIAFTQMLCCKYFYWIHAIDDNLKNNLIIAFNRGAFVHEEHFDLIKVWNGKNALIEECKSNGIDSAIFDDGLRMFGPDVWSKICAMLHFDECIQLQSPLLTRLLFQNRQYGILLELTFQLIASPKGRQKIKCRDLMKIISEIILFDCVETITLLLACAREAKSSNDSVFKIKISLCVICVSFLMLKAIKFNKYAKRIRQNIKTKSNYGDILKWCQYLYNPASHGMNVVVSQYGFCLINASQMNDYLMICALKKIWQKEFKKHFLKPFA